MRINKYYILSIFLFITGFVMLGVGVAKGEGAVGLALFIPVVYGSGILMYAGFICIGLGFLLLLFGFFETVSFGDDVYYDVPVPRFVRRFETLGDKVEDDEGDIESGERQARRRGNVRLVKKRTKAGGILLIGPFPIIYGSDRNMAMTMALLTVFILLVVAFLMVIYFWKR